jgi:hypothetical protein
VMRAGRKSHAGTLGGRTDPARPVPTVGERTGSTLPGREKEAHKNYSSDKERNPSGGKQNQGEVLAAENKTWEPDFALARENEKRPDLTGGLTAATRAGGTW